MDILPEKIYQKLLLELKTLLQSERHSAASASNEEKVRDYWQAGKKICQMRRRFKNLDEDRLLKQLAESLTLEASLFYRLIKFHEIWPEGVPKFKNRILSWSHHRETLNLEEKARLYYLKQADEKMWGHETVRKAIRKNLYELGAKKDVTPVQLKRQTEGLHIYKAKLLKVVDGDTFEALVDLGFDVWTQQRFRLHGINTQERRGKKPELAEKARLFVEAALQDLPFVVIQSYKSDLYGRYVADVFYHPVFKKKEQVFLEGFFLNEELLKAGMAELEL